MSTPFEIPAAAAATGPPPVRDAVRLLVATPEQLRHAVFRDLGQFLVPGDLLVVNRSATLAAAVDGVRQDGRAVTIHFATALDDGSWVVEVRPRGLASGPVDDTAPGQRIALPGGASLQPVVPHPAGQHRLWRAAVRLEGRPAGYLARHGRPIRYGYVPTAFPLQEYQTVFGREPGSAEMPSAGRPFSAELVTRLVSDGVDIAPITLHTGVSSQSAGEPPQPERFAVPVTTARRVNSARAAGARVIAVGTTATRALESATDRDGVVQGRSGWTDLVMGADRPAQVVNGLITGWHAPGASHLDLLRAVAGSDLVDRAYQAAVASGYRWHEFGDSCLLLP